MASKKAAVEKRESDMRHVHGDSIDVVSNLNRDHMVGIAALADSIRIVGLITPLSVRPGNKPGRSFMTAGHRRLEALRLIEKEAQPDHKPRPVGRGNAPAWDRIPVKMEMGLDMGTTMMINAHENLHRLDPSGWAVARTLVLYQDSMKPHPGAREIARKLALADENGANLGALKKSQVAALIRAYRVLPEEWHKAWREGAVDMVDADAAATMSKKDRAALLAKLLTPGGKKAVRDAKKAEKGSKAPWRTRDEGAALTACIGGGRDLTEYGQAVFDTLRWMSKDKGSERALHPVNLFKTRDANRDNATLKALGIPLPEDSAPADDKKGGKGGKGGKSGIRKAS